jgi:hypothetical protein
VIAKILSRVKRETAEGSARQAPPGCNAERLAAVASVVARCAAEGSNLIYYIAILAGFQAGFFLLGFIRMFIVFVSCA